METKLDKAIKELENIKAWADSDKECAHQGADWVLVRTLMHVAKHSNDPELKKLYRIAGLFDQIPKWYC